MENEEVIDLKGIPKTQAMFEILLCVMNSIKKEDFILMVEDACTEYGYTFQKIKNGVEVCDGTDKVQFVYS